MAIALDTEKTPAEIVGSVLEWYAGRGIFRGYYEKRRGSGNATYKIVWHRDRMYELTLDARRGTLRFPTVLPNVPKDSEMYKELKRFLKSRQSDALPEHRRIDPERAQVRPYNRDGSVAITVKSLDGDYEYAARKFVHLVHEIFMDFLYDGRFYQYMIDNLGLDPDKE